MSKPPFRFIIRFLFFVHFPTVELFHELCKALEVLSDPKAKVAYDAVLKAKERARLRTQALDAKRKKFKQGKLLTTIPRQ